MAQEITPPPLTSTHSPDELALQPFLDEYARSERNEDELANALATICSKTPQATWQALSLLDQYHRRRVLSTPLFRELKKQLTDIAFGSAGAHVSVDGRTLARDSTVQTQSFRTARLHTKRVRTAVIGKKQERTASLSSAPKNTAAIAAPKLPVDQTKSLTVPHIEVPESLWNAPALLEDNTAPIKVTPPVDKPSTPRTSQPIEAPLKISQPAAQISTLANQQRQRVGTLLSDRYLLIEPVVSGHISVLYKALDQRRMALPEAERYVAVKCPQESLRGDPRAVAAFQYEYMQAQAISHANIAKTFDYHAAARECYIVSELLQGESLDRLLERLMPRRLPTSRALTIVREIGHALAHAHEHGVVHGNLQASNVTITPAGDLRVSDFAQSTGWLPADAPKPQPADDLYSLACIAHELLCGCPADANLSPDDKRPDYARHLSIQQWRTLRDGLLDTNSSSTLSVRRWIADLDLQRADVRLPPLNTLESEVAKESRNTKRIALLAAAGGGAVALIAGITTLVIYLMAPAPSKVEPRRDTHALEIPNAPTSDNHTTSPDTISSTPSSSTGSQTTQAASAAETISTPSITPPTNLPTVSFAADRYVVNPGQSEAVLIVQRSAPVNRPLTLRYFTVADTAQPGIDYVGYQYVSVEIPSGESRAQVVIPLIKVKRREQPVSFDVHIGATGDALPGRAVIAKVVLPPTER